MYQVLILATVALCASGGKVHINDEACGIGRPAVIEKNSGMITFPKYKSNQDCAWRIVVPAGKVVLLTFDKLSIEVPRGQSTCSYDSLNIYDGDSATAKRLQTMCGYSSASYLSKFNITSSGREVFLTFKSDEGGNRAGFIVNFKAIEKPAPSACSGGVTLTKPGATLAPLMSYRKGKFYVGYRDDLDCTWTITAPSDNYIILYSEPMNKYRPDEKYIDIEDSSDCSLDALSVTEDGVSKKYCGKRTLFYVSNGNTIKVHFASDESTNKRGFKLGYEFKAKSKEEDQMKGCVAPMTLTAPVVLNPFKDMKNYSNGLDCTWILQAPQGKQLKLLLSESNMRPKDFLVIEEKSHAIFLANEATVTPQTIFSSSSTLTVQFKSDEKETGPGFVLSVDLLDKAVDKLQADDTQEMKEKSDTNSGAIVLIRELINVLKKKDF